MPSSTKEPPMSRQHRAHRRREIKAMLAEFRRDGCAVCGEPDPCCLTAHHRDPTKKRFSVGMSLVRTNISIQAIRRELEKCIPVCLNDHARINRGKIQWPS